jgi:hypothetical protein
MSYYCYSPRLARQIMQDIAHITRGYMRTWAIGGEDHLIRVFDNDSEIIASWNYYCSEPSIVVNRGNRNVEQYMLNLEQKRKARKLT